MPQICRAVAESHSDNEVDTKPPRRKQDIQVEKSELRKLGKDIFEGEPELQGTFEREAYIRRKVSKSMMGCRQDYFVHQQ